jgi:hypothetical protein
MNTALHNRENETAAVGGARNGARQVPLFGWDSQNRHGNGFPAAKTEEKRAETCCGEALTPFWLEDGRSSSVCRKCGRTFMDYSRVRYGGSPWIGVDLDGTLARDLGSTRGDQIGSPIEPMLNRVKRWIAEGRTVKIFTARASSPRQVAAVKGWLAACGLPDLEVTNVKDQRMIELWDDRCVQVTTNLGEPIGKKAGVSHRKQPEATRSLRRWEAPVEFFNRIRIRLFTF